MNTHLTEECFDRLWKAISALYPTQKAVHSFIIKASFKPQEIELLGTGEDMAYSLISLAEKRARIKDIVETALRPDEFPDKKELKEVLIALTDKSAYMPDIGPVTGFTTPANGNPADVMLIYDLKDKKIVSDLYTHLSPFENFIGSIKVFDMHTDPEISGGADAKKIIDEKLKKTQISLLLLTPNFFGNAGNTCGRLAITSFQLEKKTIPILLEPCMWDRISMLENIVPLPLNKKYVSKWSNKDEALLEIAQGVDAVANAIKKRNP